MKVKGTSHVWIYGDIPVRRVSLKSKCRVILVRNATFSYTSTNHIDVSSVSPHKDSRSLSILL